MRKSSKDQNIFTRLLNLSLFCFFDFRQGKMSDTYSTYMAKDDIEKVLVEATANENWNVSNSKLLQISDATFNV